MTDTDKTSRIDRRSPYSGHWIAQLHGKDIALGKTAEEALRAAQSRRHKETLEIMYIPATNTFPFSPILDSIRGCLSDDQEIFLVGGALRNALLGRESTDLDFVVPSGGIRLGRQIAKELSADFYPLDEERDTGRVLLWPEDGRRLSLDFAAYRGSSLEEDLRARDFRMNAMAFDLRSEKIFDPLQGTRDIAAKTIHVCNADSLREDPVRIIRAVRQAVELGFQIDKDTRNDIKKSVKLLNSVSSERLRDELFRILAGRHASSAVASMEILGILPFILPELPALKDSKQPEPHQYDVWNHTLSVLNALDEILAILSPSLSPEGPGDLFSGMLVIRLGRYRDRFRAHFDTALTSERPLRALLFFSALYHDVAKPQCVSTDKKGRIRFLGHDETGAQIALARARKLHLSNAEIERTQIIIRNHMRVHSLSNRLEQEGHPPSRKAIYKFFDDTGEAGVDLVLLALADVRATHAHLLSQNTWAAVLDVGRILLENNWEKPQETVAPLPFLDGNEIMRKLDLNPGPQVGAVLKAIREAQATGKVTTRDEALAFSRKWIETQT